MPENKEDISEFEEASWIKNQGLVGGPDKIRVPSDYRTFASEKGDGKYTYQKDGGISWSVPYLAGVIALALQINSNLTKEQVFEGVKETTLTNDKGLRIINPAGLMDWVKSQES